MLTAGVSRQVWFLRPECLDSNLRATSYYLDDTGASFFIFQHLGLLTCEIGMMIIGSTLWGCVFDALRTVFGRQYIQVLLHFGFIMKAQVMVYLKGLLRRLNEITFVRYKEYVTVE